MILKDNCSFANMMGKNKLIIIPPHKIIVPTIRYSHPKRETISQILFLSPCSMGLYRKYPIHVPIPTSLRFRKLRILPIVPVKPINSTPKQSRKIRREKNASKIES